MKYAIVGYGRMGREIDSIAAGRGHERVALVDPSAKEPLVARKITPEGLRRAEVVFEFTAPAAAPANVRALLDLSLAVVCGTTGWDAEDARIRQALARSRGALLLAPNFSIGMSLFTRVVVEAGRVFAAAGLHDPFILEAHHRLKADAPSGTARKLGELLLGSDRRFRSLQEGNPRGRLPAGKIHVASVRAGSEFGTHTVGFDGEHDLVTLTHRARGRSGLALGAVLAGEWLFGRRGRHGFQEVVDDLIAASSPRRRTKRGGKGGRA